MFRSNVLSDNMNLWVTVLLSGGVAAIVEFVFNLPEYSGLIVATLGLVVAAYFDIHRQGA